jgi:hypothetical protein
MAARPALVKQSDLTRLIKGAVAAGVIVERIEARPDGSVIIFPKGSAAATDPNPFDALLP